MQPKQQQQEHLNPSMQQTNWPPVTSISGMAIASFVMAILGLIGVPVLCSILAVVFGKMAIREIDGSYGRLSGRGMARAGMITGYVTLGIEAVGLIIGAAAITIHVFRLV